LLYTGVQPASTEHPELQTQCVAIGDGVNFTKVPQNPVMADAELPPEYSRIDFRDPKLWWDEEEEKFYCVVGNRHPERQGTILMFESEDALKWSFVTELDSTNNEYGRMWECPDFFELDGVQLLLTSPQEMQATTDGEFHAGYGTVAVLGSYDKHSHTFTRSAIQPIDYGLDFYAPQTTLAPDGRRIMIGWMENWEACGGRPRRHKWFGRMSLPREISVKNGRLYQMPVRELSSLWQTNTRLGGLTINGEASFAQICGRCIDMTITLDVAASPNCRRFAVRLAQNDRLFTEIRCELTHNELVFDRSRGGSHRDIPHTRHIKAAPKDGVLRLRIVMDSESIELFVNDGERALSALIPDTASDADRVTFYSDAPLCMDVEHHVLK
jgi:beta-fructofuranosidase